MLIKICQICIIDINKLKEKPQWKTRNIWLTIHCLAAAAEIWDGLDLQYKATVDD